MQVAKAASLNVITLSIHESFVLHLFSISFLLSFYLLCDCRAALLARSEGGYRSNRSCARDISSSYGRSWGIRDRRWWTMAMSHSLCFTSFSLCNTIWGGRDGRIVSTPGRSSAARRDFNMPGVCVGFCRSLPWRRGRWASTGAKTGKSRKASGCVWSRRARGQTTWWATTVQRWSPPQLWWEQKKNVYFHQGHVRTDFYTHVLKMGVLH